MMFHVRAGKSAVRSWSLARLMQSCETCLELFRAILDFTFFAYNLKHVRIALPSMPPIL